MLINNLGFHCVVLCAEGAGLLEVLRKYTPRKDNVSLCAGELKTNLAL